jgi:hypothetical protein
MQWLLALCHLAHGFALSRPQVQRRTGLGACLLEPTDEVEQQLQRMKAFCEGWYWSVM